MSGKAVGAALKIAAPEAAVAAKATGAGKPKPAAGSAADHKAKIDAIKAQRPAEHEDQADEHEDQADGPTSGRQAGGMTAGGTGGGFVLGVMVWAVVRAYIGNPGQPSGAAGVKRLLAAKFLNKTA